jgi:spoIIIJ-associated protein
VDSNFFKEELKSLIVSIFSKIGENPEISIYNEVDGLLAEITLDEPSYFIGKQGEILNSIQYLIKIMLSRKINPLPQFMIDIGEYKKKQISILRNIAITSSIKVRKTLKPLELSPMSPFGRRIIHMTLKDNPQVTTYSTGEGAQRRVIIDLKK